MNDEMHIRPADPGDIDLIVSTWRFCYGSPVWGDRNVRMGDFKNGHRAVMARALESGQALVVADNASPGTVLGWAVGGPGLLHYVYVKKEFRGDGLCRELTKALGCEEGPVTVTHLTKPIEKWRAKREVRFNPYLLIA